MFPINKQESFQQLHPRPHSLLFTTERMLKAKRSGPTFLRFTTNTIGFSTRIERNETSCAKNKKKAEFNFNSVKYLTSTGMLSHRFVTMKFFSGTLKIKYTNSKESYLVFNLNFVFLDERFWYSNCVT